MNNYHISILLFAIVFVCYSCSSASNNSREGNDCDSCELIQDDNTSSLCLNSPSAEIDTALFHTQFNKWKKFHHDIRSKNIDSLNDVEWRGERISRKAEREDSVIARFNYEGAVYGRVQLSFHQDSLPRQDVATFIIALDLFSNDEFNIGLFSFEIYDKNNSVFQNYLIHLSDLLSDEEKRRFIYNFTRNSLYSWVDRNYNKLQQQGIDPEEYWQTDYTNIWPEFAKFNPELVEWYSSNGFTAEDLSSGRFNNTK